MTVADLLRQAAAEMRQRAQAATPGPWEADSTDTYDAQEVYSKSTEGTLNEPDVAGTYRNPVTGNRKANAAHIASWHPAVALAVADWLDMHLSDLTRARNLVGACDSPADLMQATRVARAYLGTEAAPDAR